MAVHVFARRGRFTGGVLLALAALAGCQSGDRLGALDLGGGARSQDQQTDQINVQELLAYCPQITLRLEDAIRDTYARGGEGDPAKLIQRASITEATRSCSFNGGTMSIDIAVAGRIVPGPVGSAGTVRLPLRVTVTRDLEEIYSQQHIQEVAVTDTAGATQFLFTDSSFSMPNPTARNIRVFVGIDGGDGRD